MTYVTYRILCPDVKQAAEFYKRVFGWDARGWGGDADYLVSQHGEGSGPDGKPLAAAVITVRKLDETLAVAAKAGATVVEKFAIAGVGYAAYFTDPDSLIVSMHEYDANAK